MFKWLKREKIAPLYVVPGDKIVLSDNKRGKLMEADITETIVVNEVGAFEFENEFDLKKGVGGVFGESLDDSEDKS